MLTVVSAVDDSLARLVCLWDPKGGRFSAARRPLTVTVCSDHGQPVFGCVLRAYALQAPSLPERSFLQNDCQLIDGAFRRSHMGVHNKDAITDTDIEWFKQAMQRPGEW
jgi:hypothetical protein